MQRTFVYKMRAETRQNIALYPGCMYNCQLKFFAVLYMTEYCKRTTNINLGVAYIYLSK